MIGKAEYRNDGVCPSERGYMVNRRDAVVSRCRLWAQRYGGSVPRSGGAGPARCGDGKRGQQNYCPHLFNTWRQIWSEYWTVTSTRSVRGCELLTLKSRVGIRCYTVITHSPASRCRHVCASGFVMSGQWLLPANDELGNTRQEFDLR